MPGLWSFTITGILFHFLFIFTIFDIYFRTPLSQGMQRIPPPLPPKAKRVIIVLADGLRADKAFNPGVTPHLRFAAGMRGAYGVSHTRVPTESRPGHVALLAGFYEDVSAVAKGWQENPVEFDHIFKTARYSFLMGAPEIMHIFHKQPNNNKRNNKQTQIWTDSFNSELVDFGIKDARVQDEWTFRRFERLLQESKTDQELERKLKSDQVVIFLHCLGHDTNGHAHGPQSPEYKENTKFLDQMIQRLEKTVDDYYENDGKTAWVFTADHGMSDGHSHGDGNPQNTMTPLIAWGAGVRGPQYLKSEEEDSNGHDEYSRGWGISAKRVDVSQADICPLLAALLGVPIPVNSEGILPLNYLDLPTKEKLLMSEWNLRQLLENYRIKEGN